MNVYEIGERQRRPRILIWVAILAIVLFFSRSICATFIDYYWWRELGQVQTWLRISAYEYVPSVGAWVLVFALFWLAHARGMKHAGERLRDHGIYKWISTAAIALLALVIATAAVDGWTVARFFGGRGMSTGEWRDPVFGEPLGFYFFDLPFYKMLIDFAAIVALIAALGFYLVARLWQLRRDLPNFGSSVQIDLSDFRRLGNLESGMLKGLTAGFLVMLAAGFWLGR